mmetsp:Transcript_16125/g.44353  ORF Transcript_16125/g.44353 Transcript_16125/m.44353 type:complete len:223 (-) Transcript_16125:236-904(-)
MSMALTRWSLSQPRRGLPWSCHGARTTGRSPGRVLRRFRQSQCGRRCGSACPWACTRLQGSRTPPARWRSPPRSPRAASPSRTSCQPPTATPPGCASCARPLRARAACSSTAATTAPFGWSSLPTRSSPAPRTRGCTTIWPRRGWHSAWWRAAAELLVPRLEGTTSPRHQCMTSSARARRLALANFGQKVALTSSSALGSPSRRNGWVQCTETYDVGAPRHS